MAAGTPLELKARHGVGYSLTVVLDQRAASPRPGKQQPKRGKQGGGASGGEAAGAAGSGAAAARVEGLVARSVPGAKVISAAGAEVVMQLPREGVKGFPQVRGPRLIWVS